MGKKRPEPNKKYNILLGLSIKGKTFGSGKQAENKNSKAIYEVGCALKKLIPLPDGPFHGFNPDDGWKPRFKIESFLTDNDEYYRKDDFHFSLDESRDGNDDDDDNYDDNE